MNPRLRDGLLGALVAVVVLVLAAGALVWSVTDPARGGSSAAPPAPGAGTGRPGAGEPPSDLGPAEMWLDDLVLDAGTVALPGSTLRDVTVTAGGVRTGPDGLVAASMVVDATVPFDVVAAQIGEGTVVRSSGGSSEAVVERTLELAGRRLDAVATGTVEVVDGRLVVEPTTIDVGGPSFLAGALGAVARRLVRIEHEVEGLPEGLMLRDVVVRDDGFRANLRGEDVRLELAPGS